jgi:hypothetical protein
VHHILVSSAETRRAFKSGFDTVNLHRPTEDERRLSLGHGRLEAAVVEPPQRGRRGLPRLQVGQSKCTGAHVRTRRPRFSHIIIVYRGTSGRGVPISVTRQDAASPFQSKCTGTRQDAASPFQSKCTGTRRRTAGHQSPFSHRVEVYWHTTGHGVPFPSQPPAVTAVGAAGLSLEPEPTHVIPTLVQSPLQLSTTRRHSRGSRRW